MSEDTATNCKSLAWAYFNKINKSEAQCSRCKVVLKTPSGSTTSLVRHLNLHADIKREFDSRTDDRKKAKLSHSVSSGSLASTSRTCSKQQTLFDATNLKLNPEGQRAKAITHAIGEMMVLDFQPYSVVQDIGFQRLMKVLEPKYELPSRTTFSRNVVPKMYDAVKVKIQSSLNEALPAVPCLSLTCDMWTSRANDSYISLTCHYITEDFSMQRHVLGNSNFPGSHSAIAIHTKLNEMLSEWGLSDVTIPIYIVTDNARNIVAAVNKSNWESVSCMAHTLQLMIVDAKKQTPGLDAVLSKARGIVGHYKHSSKARNSLARWQKQLGVPQHKLIQDVETRWNSEFHMLARLLEQKEAIAADLVSKGEVDTLSSSDWSLITGVVKILQPVEQATTELCAEKYPSLSLKIPVVYGIQSVLENHIERKEHGSGIVFARNLLKSLKSRFPMYKRDAKSVLAMTLDPRFKTVLLDDHEIFSAKEKIISEIRTVLKCSTHEEIKQEQPPKTVHVSSLWSAFDKLSEKAQSVVLDAPEQQLSLYLGKERTSRHDCPLKWWKENASDFPLVAKVARHFLSIPATEVSSERLFSAAGNVVTSRRENILPEHLEEQVFLNFNLL